MKQRKYKLFSIILLCFSPLFSIENKEYDFLAGSLVKSEKWEIDRGKNLEIFQGSVNFKNAIYELKADNAIYNQNSKIWQAYGNVSCLRKFEDKSEVLSFCDSARYNENMEEAKMMSKSEKNLVKSIYSLADGRVITTLSKTIHANNKEGKVEFENNFSVYDSSSIVIGERGFFLAKTGEFIITGGQPLATGENEKYHIYIEGEKITLNRDSGIIKAETRVKGLIINKE